MADAKERNISKLATVTVDFNTTGSKQTLYTVPTGKSCLIDHVKIIAPASTLAACVDVDFGSNVDGTLGDFVTNVSLASLTATTHWAIVAPTDRTAASPSVAQVQSLYVAADVFGLWVVTGAAAAASTTVMVFGTLY